MKANYMLICILLFLILSCTERKTASKQTKVVTDTIFSNEIVEIKENSKNKNLDSIKQVLSKKGKTSIDTLKYHFTIEDVGTEGNEGTAYYIENELQMVEFDIYTSMWKIHLQYFFNKNKIQITEETYNIYENTKLIKKISYKTNLEGVPLEKTDSNRVDVFQKIRSTIPFDLK